MARTHLDATHCIHCGKTHARGIYLVTHLLESEGTWRLGRFCSHRCVELMIQELDGKGVKIPDDLVVEPIVEPDYDEEAYEEMMRCVDIIEEGEPELTLSSPPANDGRRPAHNRWAPIYTSAQAKAN